ncbi:MAG: hypothetical protein EA401_08195, partial [Planctomycetota bacterium]
AQPLPEFHWRERSAVEEDESWQQPIPYAVLIDGNDQPWVYRRSGGDDRLLDRWSVGLGGHVDPEDGQAGPGIATLRQALLRELGEELLHYPPQLAASAPPIAWIHEHDSAIGRVHLGLVFCIPWLLPTPPQPQKGEALSGVGFLPAQQLLTEQRLEQWSRLAIQAMGGSR